MFWKIKDACPVEPTVKEWIEHGLLWFEQELGKDFLLQQPTITPTTRYFDRKLQSTEESALYCLQKVAEWMDVDPGKINLSFYSEETIEFSEGMGTEHDPESKTSAGMYQERQDGLFEIMIEVQQLRDPLSLIATFAHELGHVKLLGERKISENDEYLTDLATVVWGFGLFNANSVISSKAWHGTSHHGWSVGSQGYMTQQMFAYALALLANYRNEQGPDWAKFLCRDVAKYFDRANNYITANLADIKFK